MRRLHYTGGYVITADAVCKATLRYARALAEAQTSDVVSVPVLGEGGTIATAHLLLGPASQLYSVPVADALDEFPASDVIAELERRTRLLQPSRPEWPDEMEDLPLIDDYT